MATSKKPASSRSKNGKKDGKAKKAASPRPAPKTVKGPSSAEKKRPASKVRAAKKTVSRSAKKPARPKAAEPSSPARAKVGKAAAKAPSKKPAKVQPRKTAKKSISRTGSPHSPSARVRAAAPQVASPGTTAKIRFVEEDRDPVKAAAAKKRKIPRELIAEFRQILDQKRQAILQKARMTIEEGMKLDEAELPDEYDQATSEYLQYFTLRLRGREKYFLDKIEQALGRISEGTFGYCESCGEEIGMNRLRARPETTLCIRCKEAQEREERQFGD